MRTLKEVADRAGVSRATAGLILSGGATASRFKAPTRQRVLDAAREIGYRPNRSARALATGRSRLIALQLYRLDSPFAMKVARRLQALAWQDGYEVLVHEFLGSDAGLVSVVDGVLLFDRMHEFAPRDSGAGPEETAAETDKPQVAIGAFYSDARDYVGVDLEPASQQAARLLIASGRRRIAFVGWQEVTAESEDARVRAYASVLTEAGLPTEHLRVVANTRAEGRRAVAEFLTSGGSLDALVCTNDELAVGCYRALGERGLRIPDEVAVVGCDGIEEGEYLQPPLTTLVQPIEEMCRLGWDYLKRRIEDRAAEPQRTVLPARLELRASHGATRA